MSIRELYDEACLAVKKRGEFPGLGTSVRALLIIEVTREWAAQFGGREPTDRELREMWGILKEAME